MGGSLPDVLSEGERREVQSIVGAAARSRLVICRHAHGRFVCHATVCAECRPYGPSMAPSTTSARSDPLQDDVERRFAAAGRSRHVGVGESLVFEGGRGRSIWYLTSGHVAVHSVTIDGDVVTHAVLGRGELIGECAWFAPDDGRTASVVALDEVTAWVVPADRFVELRSEPVIADFITNTAVQRVGRLTRQVIDICHAPAEQRVVKRLCELATLYADDDLAVVIPVSQDLLASLAATSRQTANGVLRALVDDGVIKSGRARITVVDPAALRNRAERA
jgi:CRP-like cAMP-binding protein